MAKNFPNLGRESGILFLRLIGHPNISSRDGLLALYSQQKQNQELTVAQIINSLLPNSDLN